MTTEYSKLTDKRVSQKVIIDYSVFLQELCLEYGHDPGIPEHQIGWRSR